MQDDLFKLYAAQKTENGYPLVISQHGGGYGSYLFAFNEYITNCNFKEQQGIGLHWENINLSPLEGVNIYILN